MLEKKAMGYRINILDSQAFRNPCPAFFEYFPRSTYSPSFSFPCYRSKEKVALQQEKGLRCQSPYIYRKGPRFHRAVKNHR